MKSSVSDIRNVEELQKEVEKLSSQVEQSQSEAEKAQSEVDRLLGIIKDSENEKNEKENQIKELQEYVLHRESEIGSHNHKYEGLTIKIVKIQLLLF